MERQGWTWCCIVGLTISNVLAQEAAQRPNPAPNVQIVRVRIGKSCGWCTGNYDDNVTTIEPGSIVRSLDSTDPPRTVKPIRTSRPSTGLQNATGWTCSTSSMRECWRRLRINTVVRGARMNRPCRSKCSSATGQGSPLATM